MALEGIKNVHGATKQQRFRSNATGRKQRTAPLENRKDLNPEGRSPSELPVTHLPTYEEPTNWVASTIPCTSHNFKSR